MVYNFPMENFFRLARLCTKSSTLRSENFVCGDLFSGLFKGKHDPYRGRELGCPRRLIHFVQTPSVSCDHGLLYYHILWKYKSSWTK